MTLWWSVTLALVCFAGGVLLWSLGGAVPPAEDAAEGESALPPDVLSTINELQLDHATGKLDDGEYAQAREAVLQELPQRLAESGPGAATGEKTGLGSRLAMVLLLVCALVGLGAAWAQQSRYSREQKTARRDLSRLVRDMQQQAAQEGAGVPPQVQAMVDRLKNRLKEKPDDLKGQLMLGRSLMELGDMVGAKDAYMAASRLDPENAEAFWGLGMVLLSSGEKKAAAVALDAALARDGDMEQALYVRARLFAGEEKQPQKAAALLRHLSTIMSKRLKAQPQDDLLQKQVAEIQSLIQALETQAKTRSQEY